MSTSDETIADLFALISAGRSDPLVEVALQDADPQTRAALRHVREAAAGIALLEPPMRASAALRTRVLRSLEKDPRPIRRAVLVLDMLNDHLQPGRPLEVPRARDIVPALSARLDAARAERTPVIYVVDQHDPEDADLDIWGAHNVRGTEGAEIWAPLAPKTGDCVVSKVTYSAFTSSSLGQVLGELRVDTLVLTGCLTEIGLLATATDALQRGYAVELPRDTQAGATERGEEAVLGIVGLLHPYGPARQGLLASVERGV